MKDQHKKINTYRDLGQEDIDLMNELKQAEAIFLDAIEKVGGMRQAQQDFLAEGNSSVDGLSAKQIIESKRNLKIAKVKINEASMWAVRAVALPDAPQVEV